jgi:diguanylate cyclase (GGDEF)-like protein
MPQQHDEPAERVSEAFDRTPRVGARGSSFDTVARVVGVLLIAGTILLILTGPDIVDRQTLTVVQLLAISGIASFGVLLALMQRNAQNTLERAYSSHLEELSQRLRNMAYRDAVTGLYNHRYFREQLAHEIERSLRYGEPLSLILLDMNNFKEVNDRYGHFMGDRFLGLVGEVVDRQIRASDVGARYGGDEFVIILPSTPRAEAERAAEKLSEAVANCAAMTATGETVQLGISFGVATCAEDARTSSDLIEAADARLYEVKRKRGKPGRSTRSRVA